MRRGTRAIAAVILLLVMVPEAGAGGEPEKEPVFDLKRPGWQDESVQAGFGGVRPAEEKIFQVLFKSVSGIKKNRLDLLVRDYVGPGLGLYASSGAAFTLRREGGGAWRAEVAKMAGETQVSLLRTAVSHSEDYGDHRLVSYQIKSYDGRFPVWSAGGDGRFVFRGVWNLSPAEVPEYGAVEPLIARALERLAAERGTERGPMLLSGRFHLLECRYLHVSRDRLAFYIRLAVEI